MVEVTGKLARWRLRLSEFEFGTAPCAGIERRAADVLSGLKNNGEGKTSLDDEVSVFTKLPAFFASVPQMETNYFEFIQEPKGLFLPFTMEVCMIAGIMDSEKAEMKTLAEFITAQYSDEDYHTAFTCVKKWSTRFNVDRDEVLARVSPLHVGSQRVVPSFLSS